jgi:hypothetical protein
MPTVVTHDLIRCNRINVTLPSVNNPGLIPFNGQYVRFDNDNTKSYSVKKNVQGRFKHPEIPFEDPWNPTPPSDIQYLFTSMLFNGQEYIGTSVPFNLNAVDVDITSFPLYTVGNEYNYTSNIANGVVVGTSVVDLGFGVNNFYEFLESLINSNNIPVKITRTPELWWSDTGFPRINNFTLEKHYDVNFELTCEVTSDDTTKEYRYVFNGETVFYFIDGVNIVVSDPGNTTNEHPQFSDEYSFYSYDYDFEVIDEIPACPIFDFFGASLQTDGCSNLSISCDCKNIKFSDTSNYNNNFLPGHDPELFTTRKIVLTRPNGTTYTWGTSNFTDVDQVIPPHFSSPNTFQYVLSSSDQDGIYEVQLCTYPDWSSEVYYNSGTSTIVRRGDVLYKNTVSNSNLDPSNPANSNYWEVYTCSNDCNSTRYCTTEKIVVLCVSLLKCYKKLVADAFCSMESNPCKSMCDNKAFMNAMKFRITMDALEFAVCAGDWTSAKKHIDVLKSICCCNG